MVFSPFLLHLPDLNAFLKDLSLIVSFNYLADRMIGKNGRDLVRRGNGPLLLGKFGELLDLAHIFGRLAELELLLKRVAAQPVVGC